MRRESRLTPEQVVSAFNSILGLRGEFASVTAGTELSRLDLASVDLVEILLILEDMAGCELDPNSVPQPEVVGDLAELKPRPREE